MVQAVFGLADQLAEAADRSRTVEGLPDHDDIENVVVLGMGGSGVAGDVMAAVAAPFMAVPVIVSKSYGTPAFVGRGSLVFAVSFSGNTEETLEAVTEAYEDGARIVAVTSGGELGRLAGEWGVPRIDVPTAIPQPRAGIGAMSIPPLMVLEQVGLFPGASRWVDLAVKQLRSRSEELAGESSIAATIAKRIGRTIPLVYGTDGIGAAAALRWKNQVNENAKCPAFTAVYPELCHNELAGWGQHGDVTRQAITLVNLRHDEEHPQVSRRVELVSLGLEEVVAAICEVRASGEGGLAQLFDLIFIGDVVSLEMAGSEGIDPGPIPVLDDIKRQLRS